MQRVYPDLHTGRFVCLADFNTPQQAALCRTVRPVAAGRKEASAAGGRRDGTVVETAEQPTISVLRSVDETGAGSLRFRLGSPDEELRFDGVRSPTLGLLRDWQGYELLMFQLYGPRVPAGAAGLTVEFSIFSGPDLALCWTRRLLLTPGWQLFRLDLAEITDSVDLADIRALVWRVPQLADPVELYLDDVIVTDNTRWLLNEDAAEGQLYVLTRGRRIHVGARGRFELAFCDGLIVAWQADDGPNLTVRSGLGPWPVPLPADWYTRRAEPVVYDDPALFAGWGGRVAAAQRLVELSDFRVVLEGRWRFAPPEQDAAAPEHHWRYVIYPTGQVYVLTDSRTAGAAWSHPRLGYAIAVSGRVGFGRVASSGADGQRPPTSFVLLAQQGRQRPDLLWCPHRHELAERQVELAPADDRRTAVTVGDVPAEPGVANAHLLRFWPPDLDGVPEAETFAADYQHPAGLLVAHGRVVTDAAGDLAGDGFNEAEGCYELTPTGGLLRFVFDPGRHLRHQPIFRVHGTAGQQCWVYADGAIVRDLGRDADGDLLFRIPRVLSERVSVELHVRPRRGAP